MSWEKNPSGVICLYPKKYHEKGGKTGYFHVQRANLKKKIMPPSILQVLSYFVRHDSAVSPKVPEFHLLTPNF